MKKILIPGALVLLLFGNEVLAWLALDILATIGVVAFLKAAAKGGAFDD